MQRQRAKRIRLHKNEQHTANVIAEDLIQTAVVWGAAASVVPVLHLGVYVSVKRVAWN